MNNLDTNSIQTFEQLKQVDQQGNEFWYARAIAKILDYSDFRNFVKVINKAIAACEASGNKASDHIVEVNEMVKIGSNTERSLNSFSLSRYACYLIVQNGDPTKPVIAAGQTYFALQARRQELQSNSEFSQLREDEKRLYLRNELKGHNKQLVDAAALSGVESSLDFAIFQNHGYKGLYGGLDARGIDHKKQLKKSQKILDHMGSTELAANLFRATQVEEKLKRDHHQYGNKLTKNHANKTHFEVGKKVRETIASLGGTMPENLPASTKSTLKIAKEQAKLEAKKMMNRHIKHLAEKELGYGA